jgi:hypothetical protein
MRSPDGKLAGWDLPRDHFETNISNFFESVPEEVLEVKYPQSYQTTLYSSDCAHDWGRSGVCLLQSWEQEL